MTAVRRSYYESEVYDKADPALASGEISGKRIPGRSGGYKNINLFLLMQMAKQMDKHPSMSLAIGSAAKIRKELYEWIISYTQREEYRGLGYQTFRSHWKLIRSWVPLQIRLATEQIFYELGAPYRELISGFKPLD